MRLFLGKTEEIWDFLDIHGFFLPELINNEIDGLVAEFGVLNNICGVNITRLDIILDNFINGAISLSLKHQLFADIFILRFVHFFDYKMTINIVKELPGDIDIIGSFGGRPE